MPTTYAELAQMYANTRNKELDLLIKIEGLNAQIAILERLNRNQASTIDYLQNEIRKANEYVKRQSNNSFQMGD